MKQKFLLLGFVLLAFTFISCDENDDSRYEITFDYDDIESIEAENDSEINLPYVVSDTGFFLGWEDDSGTIHDQTYVVDGDQRFTPVFELFEDVLELEFDDIEKTVSIASYDGAASRVKIPHTIDDYIVSSIGLEAFAETDVTRVDIPMTVYRIGMHAFKDMPNLENVHYYGEYLGTSKRLIGKEAFDEIIDDNEVCQSTSMDKEPTEDNPWVFEDGCPITEVTGQTPPTTGPDGEVYIAYDVVQSVEDAPANMISQHFGIMPFTGSDNLSSITLPDKYSFFEPKIFKGLENLEAVYIENNPDLYSEDGVLYEKKTDNLAYYPSGLLTKDFVLPKHIEHINGWECVFYGNKTETLTLHDNVTFDYGAFGCLTGLKNIVIDGENPSYSVSDGVVYNSSETALLVYPAGKEATTYTTPNDVAIIEEYAFMNQQHIEHLIISEGVEGILDHAFFAIPSLRTVDIASTVEYILPGNFSQEPDVLGNLETIILRKDNEVFHAPGINVRETDTLEIYVPDTLIAAYEEDVWWQHYADNFIPLSELEE